MNYEHFIQQSIQWIESHLHEAISANEIAAVSGFSQSHFHRIFQNTVGISAIEYIRKRRLANAASQLLYTDERIIDIAFFYQFESQEAFTRAFKKVYQLPPGRYRKIMNAMHLHKEETKMTEQLKGWFISGSHPDHYEIGTDQKEIHQGRASGYLKSTDSADDEEFATMMQQFKADRYRGQRIQLSGFIQTKDVQHFAGLWMRVDNSSEDVLQFDNMSNRPLTGTTTWNRYSIVLDVPDHSAAISFGVLLTGTGGVWIDGLSFQTVDANTPTTNMQLENELMEEPVNLSFED
ncbi:helix-turn-helix transcriptional regulator [Planococcus alpniumensis]|uniref:helix-turn-helix transcriptional regulator n=1 Tax=Planococcus alpniumensis TaxID=2708345 RepID=UPI001B8D1B1D